MASTIDPSAILNSLGYSNADHIEPVTGGRDTIIFRVIIDNDAFALRIFRPDQLLMSQREVLAMTIAREGDVPVPEVNARGIWNDHPALLLSWCPGRPLGQELVEHPERAESLGVAAGTTLADIHNIEVPEKYRDQSWLTWALPHNEPLRQRIEAIAGTDRLLHLDYHPLNVLTDGDSVTAVLDWGNARVGDPRADLARAISILRLDADEFLPESDAVIKVFERAMVRGYTALAGEQDDMPLFHAYAGRLMLRDLAGRLHKHPGQRERIEAWVDRWERGIDTHQRSSCC